MSFAKKYLEQYNADTAWNSLRGGTGAYDYSSMPEYINTFRTIYSAGQKPKQFAKGVEDMSGIVYGFLGNARKNRGKAAQFANAYDVDSLMNSVATGGGLESINNLPQQLFKNTLAGKYSGNFPTFGINSFI